MTHLTRLDFAIGSAGLMRRALSRGDPSRDVAPRLPAPAGRPAADAERARRSRARGRGGDAARLPAGARGRRRAGGRRRRPACWCASARRSAKYWNCKRVVGVVHEALECHGGNGFIEEGPMARLYREAPLNGIWEGSGNIIALDVLRAASALAAKRAGLPRRGAPGQGRRPAPRPHGRAARAPSSPRRRSTRRGRAASSSGWPSACRRAWCIRHSPQAVADAFCATRLDGDGGAAYGSLPAGLDQRAIVERARSSDLRADAVTSEGKVAAGHRRGDRDRTRRRSRIRSPWRDGRGRRTAAAPRARRPSRPLAEIGAHRRASSRPTSPGRRSSPRCTGRSWRDHGGLDIAFNNAGYQEPRAPVAEQDARPLRPRLRYQRPLGLSLPAAPELAHMAGAGRRRHRGQRLGERLAQSQSRPRPLFGVQGGRRSR